MRREHSPVGDDGGDEMGRGDVEGGVQGVYSFDRYFCPVK